MSYDASEKITLKDSRNSLFNDLSQFSGNKFLLAKTNVHIDQITSFHTQLF